MHYRQGLFQRNRAAVQTEAWRLERQQVIFWSWQWCFWLTSEQKEQTLCQRHCQDLMVTAYTHSAHRQLLRQQQMLHLAMHEKAYGKCDIETSFRHFRVLCVHPRLVSSILESSFVFLFFFFIHLINLQREREKKKKYHWEAEATLNWEYHVEQTN